MLLNDNLFKIMAVFISDYSRQIHGRELSRISGVTQKTASNLLSRLEVEGVLSGHSVGKNKNYRLNLKDPAIEHVISVIEEEKAGRFIIGSGLPLDYLARFRKSGSPLVAVFGSYARGAEKKDSDLDAMAISPFKVQFRDLERIYGVKASVKVLDIKAFRSALANSDHLIAEVVRNHVILCGTDLFVRSLLEAGYGRHREQDGLVH